MKILFNDRDVSASLFSYRRTMKMAEGTVIGQAVSAMIEIELDNENLNLTAQECENAVISVTTFEGKPTKQYKIATYPETWDGTIAFTCYDTIGFLTDGYLSSLDYDSEETQVTIADQIAEIEEKYAVTIDRTGMPQDVLSKIVVWSDSTITVRGYLGMIAELTASNAVSSNDFGTVVFVPFGKGTKKVYDDCFGFEKKNDFKASGVTYDNGTEQITAGTDEGNMIYLEQSNLYISDDSDVQRIYENIGTLEFSGVNSFKIDTQDEYTVGDMLTLRDRFTTVITALSEEYKGGEDLICSFDSTPFGKNERNTIEKSTSISKIRKISSNMSQQDVRMDILAQDINEEKTNTANLSIALDGITERVEKTENDTKKISTVEIGLEEMKAQMSTVKASLTGTVNRLVELDKIRAVSKPTDSSVLDYENSSMRMGFGGPGTFELYQLSNFTKLYDDTKIHSISITLSTQEENIDEEYQGRTVTIVIGNRSETLKITNDNVTVNIDDIDFSETKSISISSEENGFYLIVSKMRLIEGNEYIDVKEGIQSLVNTIQQTDSTIKFITEEIEKTGKKLNDTNSVTESIKKYVVFNDDPNEASITLCTSRSANGEPDGFTMRLTSSALNFYQNYNDSEPIAYMSNSKLFITKAVVVASFQVGAHVWTATKNEDGDDLLILDYVGG